MNLYDMLENCKQAKATKKNNAIIKKVLGGANGFNL